MTNVVALTSVSIVKPVSIDQAFADLGRDVANDLAGRETVMETCKRLRSEGHKLETISEWLKTWRALLSLGFKRQAITLTSAPDAYKSAGAPARSAARVYASQIFIDLAWRDGVTTKQKTDQKKAKRQANARRAVADATKKGEGFVARELMVPRFAKPAEMRAFCLAAAKQFRGVAAKNADRGAGFELQALVAFARAIEEGVAAEPVAKEA